MQKLDVILPVVLNDSATLLTSVTRVESGVRVDARDHLAVERGLDVRLDGQPFSVVMRTPGSDRALAAGFLFSENVITGAGDVVDVCMVDGEDAIDVHLSAAAGQRAAANRDQHRRVTSNASCGVCGRSSLEALAIDAPAVSASWRISADLLVSLPERLTRRQPAFAETGGLHAAVLVSCDGDVIGSAEDIGRHNAVDKIVGLALLEGRLPLSEHLLFVSGRTSFEIVQKAWLAGIPIVAAVSAPSSLAVELAERAGITLVGFVRERRFNIYTRADRII